jgi:uncharacterized peroxidase-related enzyme
MNRLHQTDPEQATGKTKELFAAVHGRLGKIPNLMRVFANSPAVLEGYLNFSGALMHGALTAKLREQLALAISEINGCDYCLSAHTLSSGKVGLGPDDVRAARMGSAINDKSDAALKFARAVALERGQVSDAEVQAARSAGLSDAELVEIVAQVALNTLTNYTNNVARTILDFPPVKAGQLDFPTPNANNTPSVRSGDAQHRSGAEVQEGPDRWIPAVSQK